MYTYHYMYPESVWGVFCDGQYITSYMTPEEAADFCDKMNKGE